MISLLQKFAANGFADFSGLTISGTIPIKQELINELIAGYLTTAASPPTPDQASATTGIDPRILVNLVKKAEVRADSGVLTLHFEVRV